MAARGVAPGRGEPLLDEGGEHGRLHGRELRFARVVGRPHFLLALAWRAERRRFGRCGLLGAAQRLVKIRVRVKGRARVMLRVRAPGPAGSASGSGSGLGLGLGLGLRLGLGLGLRLGLGLGLGFGVAKVGGLARDEELAQVVDIRPLLVGVGGIGVRVGLGLGLGLCIGLGLGLGSYR